MTAARRLAAILVADVVGYSRLMGEGEAGTARALREHREAVRPIVADHGGRIVSARLCLGSTRLSNLLIVSLSRF
jgi:class 3 adenylate cyclase